MWRWRCKCGRCGGVRGRCKAAGGGSRIRRYFGPRFGSGLAHSLFLKIEATALGFEFGVALFGAPGGLGFANAAAAIGFKTGKGAFELAFGGVAMTMKELETLVISLVPFHRVRAGFGLCDVLFALVVAAGLAEEEPLCANDFEDQEERGGLGGVVLVEPGLLQVGKFVRIFAGKEELGGAGSVLGGIESRVRIGALRAVDGPAQDGRGVKRAEGVGGGSRYVFVVEVVHGTHVIAHNGQLNALCAFFAHEYGERGVGAADGKRGKELILVKIKILGKL
jgi:hypothetical protein